MPKIAAPDLQTILTAERDTLGLTDYALAARAGIAHTTLREITQAGREPSVRTLRAILRGLGRDFAWLHERGFRP